MLIGTTKASLAGQTGEEHQEDQENGMPEGFSGGLEGELEGPEWFYTTKCNPLVGCNDTDGGMLQDRPCDILNGCKNVLLQGIT